MRLHYATRGAITALRMRLYMKRTGKTPWGDMLWTKEEDDLVRKLHPDFKAMKKVLRRRTRAAIQARSCKLGITKKYRRWTALEASRLRKLYPRSSHTEMRAALSGLTWPQIKAQARYCKLHRDRKPFKQTGHQGLDMIRKYAFCLNLSMADLDKMARTRDYFQKAKWLVRGVPSDKALGRAVKALGGEMRPYFHDADFQRKAA